MARSKLFSAMQPARAVAGPGSNSKSGKKRRRKRKKGGRSRSNT